MEEIRTEGIKLLLKHDGIFEKGRRVKIAFKITQQCLGTEIVLYTVYSVQHASLNIA